MSAFARVDGELHVERVSLARIAQQFGTPCYVYAQSALQDAWREYDGAFAGVPHLVCYAVKANSNLAVLNVFARLGSGFDIVSGGELARVLAAGGDAAKTVFSGVGKSEAEMEAALAAGVRCFNVESAPELETLNAVAGRVGTKAPVSLRVNPEVDSKTHPYISTGLKESKFGVAFADALDIYRRAAELPHLDVVGIDMHIGSQIAELDPYRDAAAKLVALVDRLAALGITLRHIDVGGGLGIRYREETPPSIGDYASLLRDILRDRREELILEPGRRLVADAGVLLTRVVYLKPGEGRDFAIVDAAMNDLLRPALYNAWHAVDTVCSRAEPRRRYQIVGPVCESGDFLAHDRDLALAPGDLIAIHAAGAYGFAMSSNYNSRPRACEVMVDGDEARVVRQRERIADLFVHETIFR